LTAVLVGFELTTLFRISDDIDNDI